MKLISKKTSIYGEDKKEEFKQEDETKEQTITKLQKYRKISINTQNARKTASIIQYLITKNKWKEENKDYRADIYWSGIHMQES